MNYKHNQVEVKHPRWDYCIPIDEDLTELMNAIWQMDLITFNSCQDNIPTTYTWVEFSIQSGLRFLDILQQYHPLPEVYEGNVLGYRMVDLDPGETRDRYIPPASGRWLYEFLPAPYHQPNTLSIRFPNTDIKAITKTLEKHRDRPI